jgi:FkbM family methyltransferase
MVPIIRGGTNAKRFKSLIVACLLFSTVLCMLAFSNQHVNGDLILSDMMGSSTSSEEKIALKAKNHPALNDLVGDCHSIATDKYDSYNDTNQETWVNVKLENSFKMHVHPKETDDISKRLIATGCYECDLIPFTVQALQTRPNSLFLDIGSNMGLYALAAAAVGREVVAFEPVTLSYRKICESVLANPGFADLVTLIPRAVSDLNGANVMFRFWTGNYAGITVKAAEQDVIDSNQVEGVEYARTVTVDSLDTPELPLLPTDRPVVVKIDVEGFECNALLGAMEYLKRVEILYAQVECKNGRFDKDKCYQEHDVHQLFLEKGLMPYLMHNGTKTPLVPAEYRQWKSPKSYNFDVGWYPAAI